MMHLCSDAVSSVFILEINCGGPPDAIAADRAAIVFNDTVMHSMASYHCKQGYRYQSGNNISVCRENGQWDLVDVQCQGRLITVDYY